MDWQLVGHDLETSSETVGAAGSMLSSEWEAVGPFPSGMREHALTRSPLTAYAPEDVDFGVWFSGLRCDASTTWPSDLPAGGRVGWTRFRKSEAGWTEVAYPNVNWEQLRADHGWAALQYEAILRSSLDIAPTAEGGPVGLLVDSSQLVEYAFVRAGDDEPVAWCNGDIYDFANTPSGRKGAETSPSNFARSITLAPGKYVVLVRVIYEIRMFGDPGTKAPAIRFRLDFQPDSLHEVGFVPGLDIVPDLFDGRIMGDWMAIGVRVPAVGVDAVLHSCEIVHEKPGAPTCDIINTPRTRISAGQTRRVPLRIRQKVTLDEDSKMQFRLRFTLGPRTVNLTWHPMLRRRLRTEYFKFTFDPSATISHLVDRHIHEPGTEKNQRPTASHDDHTPPQIGYAIAIPPPDDLPSFARGLNPGQIPVTLGLHGAGVDVEWDEWIKALPKTGGWAVLPTGKNEWGEDWHGSSMQDAWAARDALHTVVNCLWEDVSAQTLVIGHSNGGQGAWHVASRYPDRVVGVIGAAGYVKVQDYVPYTESVSSPFADPALIGILNDSLTPYNNDLYLSNLVHVPCIALHGGADGNVPPRHSRVYASIISSWSKDPDAVEIVEVEGRDHWWDGMLDHPRIMDFIKRVVTTKKRSYVDERRKGYTLTTACVDESGSKGGVRIVELETPGRLGRLDVFHSRDGETGPDSVRFRSTNIKRIDVVAADSNRSHSFIYDNGSWDRADGHQMKHTVPALLSGRGPMIRMLASKGPLCFISGDYPPHRRLANRLAHDLFVYHRLESEIISADDADAKRMDGNVVVIGRPEDNDFLRQILESQANPPVSFPRRGTIQMNTSGSHGDHPSAKVVYEDRAGIIALLPRPNPDGHLTLLIAGNDDEGTDAAAKLFPLRTGMPLPDWAIVGLKMAYRGAGGMIAAGFWANGTTGHPYNPVMSWFDR